MTLATSHGSAPWPKASRAASSSSRPRGDLGEELVDRQAGSHRVHANARLRRLDGRTAGERHDAGLGGRVVGLPGLGPPAEDRCVVDDDAAAPLHHVAKRRAGHPEGSGQGDPQDRVPLIVGHVDDVRGAAESRVVDQHVDATQLRDRRVDQTLDLLLLGDVAEEVGRRAPVSFSSSSAASPRRRSWMSLIITVAPSSAQRLATAKPMPVPAAAVTRTVLPSRRWCPST